ncbi:biotin/lipoyl-binding protein, partial [Streptococcus suis]|uniref:biotin/lipoyl-binding protein n=2 Tax=Bacteria TaxID=2 RepID=UPI003CE78A2F
RTETVRGILVTERPSAKVAAPASGIVAELAVREGTVVRKGDRLAVIALDRHAAAGGAVMADGIASLDIRQSL